MFLFSLYEGDKRLVLRRFFSMLDTGDFRFNNELNEELEGKLKSLGFDETNPLSLIHVDNTCYAYHDKHETPYRTLTLEETLKKMNEAVEETKKKVICCLCSITCSGRISRLSSVAS